LEAAIDAVYASIVRRKPTIRPTVSVAAPLARTDAAALFGADDGANVGADVRTVTVGVEAVAVTPVTAAAPVAADLTTSDDVTALESAVATTLGLLTATAHARTRQKENKR
jgi:hypothetical protein